MFAMLLLLTLRGNLWRIYHTYRRLMSTYVYVTAHGQFLWTFSH